MIIDSSALVAVLLEEDAAGVYYTAMRDVSSSSISAASYLETAIVVDARRNRALANRLDPLLARLEISIIPVSADQARLARQAYRDFGKGSQHPAKLNFGDCFAYALAIETDEPLLFKGNDFGLTGVRVALPE